MSSVRFIFKDLCVNRFWSAWTRSVIVGRVVRRCRKDRSVRDVLNCFRQTFLRPRRSLLFYATAACKANTEEKPGKPQSCSRGISDEDLESLLQELDGIEELAKQTLYCENCNKRIIINNKHPNVKYCPCKASDPPEGSPDGWEPYMEAEDVIIWRKEYKKGGLYAYKVYGRYKDLRAADFAAVNIDGAYRRKWDNAVAALAVVERNANGLPDQAVLHWEVLWPRLFANRDYVYIRRHKEYSVKRIHSPHFFDEDTPRNDKKPHKHRKTTKVPKPPSESPEPPQPPSDLPAIFNTPPATPPKITVTPPKIPPKGPEDRPSVHDNAKQKSLEMYSREPPPAEEKTNKVYVIISRSCTHPDVPATRNAIRVSEYWSHMVVKTLHGEDQVGMEFVLTYYDEPAVGGMPSGVTAWATGRATPTFLANMRIATKGYAAYRRGRKEDIPDFTPFNPEVKKVSYDEEEAGDNLKEEDMESSKTGPDMDNGHTKDEGTQTEETHPPNGDKGTGDKGDRGDKLNATEDKPKVTEDKAVNTDEKKFSQEIPTRPGGIKLECEIASETQDEENTGRGWWWRPFYYFV